MIFFLARFAHNFSFKFSSKKQLILQFFLFKKICKWKRAVSRARRTGFFSWPYFHNKTSCSCMQVHWKLYQSQIMNVFCAIWHVKVVISLSSKETMHFLNNPDHPHGWWATASTGNALGREIESSPGFHSTIFVVSSLLAVVFVKDTSLYFTNCGHEHQKAQDFSVRFRREIVLRSAEHEAERTTASEGAIFKT